MKWRSLEESSPETEIRPLREIFAERKELISKYVPPQTQAVHAATITALKQQRLAANIFLVGAKIPEFQLQDHNENHVTVHRSFSKARLVLCFFRGRWCPFCVAQMEAMNLILPEDRSEPAQLSPRFHRKLFSNHSSCATSTSFASRSSPIPVTKSQNNSASPTAFPTSKKQSISAPSSTCPS